MESINVTASSNELDVKINAILSIIVQDDGDSFAKRAEMYYQKRPQLIQMVEDLHKSYRSLAEKYDQLRSQLNHHSHSHDPSPTLLLSSSSPKELVQHSNFHHESTSEDPDVETELDDDFSIGQYHDDNDSKMKSDDKENMNMLNGIVFQRNTSDGFQAAMLEHEKLWNELRFKVSELVEDNLSHQAELIKRNDEKRETIRDLWSKVNMDENKVMNRNSSVVIHKVTNKTNQSQVSRLKRLFLGRFMKCNGTKIIG